MSWPDVEGALRTWLREHADIQAVVGRRVFFGVPKSPTWPLITVQRIGGGQDSSEAPVDLALVQLDVWGSIDPSGNGRKAETTAAVNALRSVLGSVSNRTALTSAVDVFGIEVVSVVWAPDPEDDRPRYVVTAEVAAMSS